MSGPTSAWAFRPGFDAQDAAIAWLAENGCDPGLARRKHRLTPSDASVQEKARPLAMARLLSDVHAALDEAGVQHLFFKGPALSQYLYGDPARRACKDVDVLVPLGAFPQAKAALVSHGFQAPVSMDPSIPWMRRGSNALNMVRDGQEVELHWRAFAGRFGPRTQMPDLFCHVDSLRFGSASIPVLADTALSGHLLVHGAINGWRRMLWFTDLAQVIAARPGIVETLDHMAPALGMRRGWDVAKRLLAEMAGESGDSDDPAHYWATRIMAGWADAREDPWSPGTRLRYHIWLAGPVPVRMLSFAVLHPTQEERRLVHLPPRLHWLYWLVRPVRAAALGLGPAGRRH